MDNCVATTEKLLTTLNIRSTKKYLEDCVLSHPEHPSLLAISDTLDKYNIETLAVKIDAEKLSNMTLPCIVQVNKQGSTVFFVLKKLLEHKVEYYNDKNQLVKTSKEDFFKIWTGVCLLAETSINSKEVDIEKKITTSNILKGLKITVAICLMSWLVVNFINLEANNVITKTFVGSYTLLKIIGLIAGATLLWFDVDQYNPTLQSFCTSTNKKINCNAVLTSKHSKIFKGFITLSELSFSYFFGTLFFLIITGFSNSSLSLIGVISILSFPIIIISIYYQAIIIKQWCKFCIIIQAILVSEILLTYFGGFYTTNINIETIPLLLALFLTPLLVWKLLKPLIEQEKETNLYKRGLKKIKNNPDVLEGLLLKSKKIENTTKGLGISITNTSAKYHIIKVCNPYCGPCAKAHPILEDLVNKGKIDLQIIFTARVDANDRAEKPVSHFLAIDEKNDKTTTKKALDDWYRAENKDYDIFADKYPMNGELKQQNSKIEAMSAWCSAESITATPTIFINGYQLPKEYSVKDLTELLQ